MMDLQRSLFDEGLADPLSQLNSVESGLSVRLSDLRWVHMNRRGVTVTDRKYQADGSIATVDHLVCPHILVPVALYDFEPGQEHPAFFVKVVYGTEQNLHTDIIKIESLLRAEEHPDLLADFAKKGLVLDTKAWTATTYALRKVMMVMCDGTSSEVRLPNVVANRREWMPQGHYLVPRANPMRVLAGGEQQSLASRERPALKLVPSV